MRKLLHDLAEEPCTALVDQHSYKVSHRPRQPCSLHDRVENGALLLGWNGRIVPNFAQFLTLTCERCNLLGLGERTCSIKPAPNHYISKSARVSVDDGCHGLR